MAKQRSKSNTNLKEKVGQRLSIWIISTLDPILLILHLTIVYYIGIKADDFILAIISSSFAEIIKQSPVAENLLFGIKFFSAIGLALGYCLHTVVQLFYQAKHTVDITKSSGGR